MLCGTGLIGPHEVGRDPTSRGTYTPYSFVIIRFVSFLLLNIHVIYLFTLPYKAMGGTRA